MNLSESRDVVDALLDSLPAQWPNANLQLPDSAMGPALQARAARCSQRTRCLRRLPATGAARSAHPAARASTHMPLLLPPPPQAAFLVMSHLGGKLLLFQGSAPSLGAGKFKAREQLGAYNTEKEAAMRNPEDAFFKRCAPRTPSLLERSPAFAGRRRRLLACAVWTGRGPPPI